jgi:hypothetical protein
MTEEKKFEGDGLSRREVIARTAWAGLGVTAGLIGAGGLEKLFAQMKPREDESSPRIFGASVTPLSPIDERYPVVPTWNTELRQLAPNVYAYQQQGGTGRLNAGISNAGLFVGEDSLLFFDPPNPNRPLAASRSAI